MAKDIEGINDGAIGAVHILVDIIHWDLFQKSTKTMIEKKFERFYKNEFVRISDANTIKDTLYDTIEYHLNMFLDKYEGKSNINKLIFDDKVGIFNEDHVSGRFYDSMDDFYDYLRGLSAKDDGEDIVNKVEEYLDDIWEDVKEEIENQVQ